MAHVVLFCHSNAFTRGHKRLNTRRYLIWVTLVYIKRCEGKWGAVYLDL